MYTIHIYYFSAQNVYVLSLFGKWLFYSIPMYLLLGYYYYIIILLFFLHLNEIWSFFSKSSNKPINREKGHNERADVSAPCTEFHLK